MNPSPEAQPDIQKNVEVPYEEANSLGPREGDLKLVSDNKASTEYKVKTQYSSKRSSLWTPMVKCTKANIEEIVVPSIHSRQECQERSGDEGQCSASYTDNCNSGCMKGHDAVDKQLQVAGCIGTNTVGIGNAHNIVGNIKENDKDDSGHETTVDANTYVVNNEDDDSKVSGDDLESEEDTPHILAVKRKAAALRDKNEILKTKIKYTKEEIESLVELFSRKAAETQ